MSRWKYSLEKTFSGDEYYFVPRYPPHVASAFVAVSFEESHAILGEYPPYQYWIEKALQDFEKRWGSMDDAVFLRVLQEGKGADRLAAIFAIGHNPALTEATNFLLPFLTSSDLLERCSASCMFALRRDERAIPVLREYLCVEPDEVYGNYPIEATVWYASYRSQIASLLGTWGSSAIIPVLRQSFIHLWKEEENSGRGNVYDQDTQDALCYSLGRRGILQMFHEIELPAQQQRLALMYMVLGYIQADERFENLEQEVFLNRFLQQELVMTLVKHFALSQEGAEDVVHSFGNDIHQRNHATYGIENDAESEEEKEEIE